LAVHPLEKSPTQQPAPPAVEQLLVPLKPHPTVAAAQLFPPTHLFPLAHPVVLLSVQLVPHAVADAQSKFPGHAAVFAPVTQVPLPSHEPDDVKAPLLQLIEVPHPMPAFDGRHFPSCPPVFKAEHAMQLPLHALSQQSPSTHDPEEHSLLALQVVPFAFVSWQT
jgi:hypothetical protein